MGSPAANKAPLPPKAELAWWYQYYFATERGQLGYEKYRREFAKLIWQLASPKKKFDDATFDRTAASFDNRWRARGAGTRDNARSVESRLEGRRLFPGRSEGERCSGRPQ